MQDSAHHTVKPWIYHCNPWKMRPILRWLPYIYHCNLWHIKLPTQSNFAFITSIFEKHSYFHIYNCNIWKIQPITLSNLEIFGRYSQLYGRNLTYIIVIYQTYCFLHSQTLHSSLQFTENTANFTFRALIYAKYNLSSRQTFYLSLYLWKILPILRS